MALPLCLYAMNMDFAEIGEHIAALVHSCLFAAAPVTKPVMRRMAPTDPRLPWPPNSTEAERVGRMRSPRASGPSTSTAWRAVEKARVRRAPTPSASSRRSATAAACPSARAPLPPLPATRAAARAGTAAVGLRGHMDRRAAAAGGRARSARRSSRCSRCSRSSSRRCRSWAGEAGVQRLCGGDGHLRGRSVDLPPGEAAEHFYIILSGVQVCREHAWQSSAPPWRTTCCANAAADRHLVRGRRVRRAGAERGAAADGVAARRCATRRACRLAALPRGAARADERVAAPASAIPTAPKREKSSSRLLRLPPSEAALTMLVGALKAAAEAVNATTSWRWHARFAFPLARRRRLRGALRRSAGRRRRRTSCSFGRATLPTATSCAATCG